MGCPPLAGALCNDFKQAKNKAGPEPRRNNSGALFSTSPHVGTMTLVGTVIAIVCKLKQFVGQVFQAIRHLVQLPLHTFVMAMIAMPASATVVIVCFV
jgi:hypothetical protein